MISLIACTGRPARRANSACVSPSASRVSARVSPGGIAISGQTRSSVIIMFAHLLDVDYLHRLIEGHDEPPKFVYVDSVAAFHIALQGVKAQLGEGGEVLSRGAYEEEVDAPHVDPRHLLVPSFDSLLL